MVLYVALMSLAVIISGVYIYLQRDSAFPRSKEIPSVTKSESQGKRETEPNADLPPFRIDDAQVQNANPESSVTTASNARSIRSHLRIADPPESKESLLIGLQWFGNNCYLNAVLQAFIHSESLRSWLDSKRGDFKESPIISALKEILDFARQEVNKGKSFKAERFRNAVSSANSSNRTFGYNAQQDAEEFITHLMDTLKTESSNSNMDFVTIPIKQTTVCQICTEKNETPLPLVLLPLGIEKSSSVKEAISNFFSPEIRENHRCTFCQQKTVETTHSIEDLPDLLIISLKRFAFSQATKKTTKIHTPILLDEEIALPSEISTNSFKLVSVVCHLGEYGYGHYVTYSEVNQKWYEFNDSSIKEMNGNFDVNSSLSSNAYVLFYERKEEMAHV
jgi:ubiquitin C-terminal hydrolase